MTTSDAPTLDQIAVRVASVPGLAEARPIAARLWPTTNSVEVALVPMLIVAAAPFQPVVVKNWTFKM
jgi:hypothetical protein